MGDITTVAVPRPLSDRLGRLAKYRESKASVIEAALDVYEAHRAAKDDGGRASG